jgi:hemolysin activation/secretion protein
MSRTWQTLWALALVLALAAFISAACGSDDEPTAVQVQEQAEQQTEQQAEPVGPQPPEPDDDQADSVATTSVTLHKGLVAEGKVLGDPDAPVVIRYYGDFQ